MKEFAIDELNMILDFAEKIAETMKEISSSHVFFILQQAFGEMSWDEANGILCEVIRISKRLKSEVSK